MTYSTLNHFKQHLSDLEQAEDLIPACVMTFNANDPSGAGGLAADINALASIGVHALPMVTGCYIKDSAKIFDFHALSDEIVFEQARIILEDISPQVIKVGFMGSPENIAEIAQITADYEHIPVVAYMPNLSWWEENKVEAYQDAFFKLLLPQTSVLIGNYRSLINWLLPEWDLDNPPTPCDIASTAAEMGVPYTFITGIPLPEQYIDNILATPRSVLKTQKFELFDATFVGSGDTLSAALAGLISTGCELPEAITEAVNYLDQSLHAGFRPGMGHVIPDRMFWAQPITPETPDNNRQDGDFSSTENHLNSPHETKH